MKEEEVRYLLCLLDNHTEEVFEELVQFHSDIEESKPVKNFSKDTVNFLRSNLKDNPVTTSFFLNYIQEHTKDAQCVNKIQTIYQELLCNELSENSCSDRLISYLSLIQCKDSYASQFIQHVLKPICEENHRQHRKQILLSLVPHERPELLQIASETMHNNEPHQEFKLTPENMLELCYLEKTHWLLKAAQVYKHQLHDMKNITFKINNFTKQILIMVLIDLTNSPESYDLPSLVHQLTNIFSILDTYITSDDQLQFYLTEVKRELTIIKFCLESNCKIMRTSIFSQVLSQSALSVISQVCCLSKVDRYKVSRLLSTNNELLNELACLGDQIPLKRKGANSSNWDILTYNSYCAITKIIDTILNSAEGLKDATLTSSYDEVKRLLLSIQPLQNCLEVIENIFSCLFLRYEYLSCDEHSQDFGGQQCGAHSECSYFSSKKQTKSSKNSTGNNSGFMCNSLTTQHILNTLKLCLEKLEENVVIDDLETDVRDRFKQLLKVVNHSIWKLQLVSNLSPDSSPLLLKLCLDYVEVDDSSDDETRDMDIKPSRRKPKTRRRHTNKYDADHPMVSSTISAVDDLCSTPGSTIDFISIMLAKPTSLVALALYHNDFTKANQILEMFDLSDSEIATEVTFTEQFRNLVAKIKNILYYRDNTRYPTKELSALSVVSTEVMGLVEGFLASNRAPNSFDVMELGARHPHLQLYKHQNSPFINAVDILLSSGLNREITYGLINVVERKLAEVRTSTDIAAVKKTNYIRFVEDIASVTFEIFGNTEKSFNFVDNICGLITDCRVPIKHKEFCKLNQLAKELRQSCEDLSCIVTPCEDKSLDQNLLQKYHQIFMNVVAASDKDLCNVSDVTRQGTKKARTPYLRMCYMYCKTVSQLEQEDKPTESAMDSPYFAVLEKPLHDIFGNMINNKEIPVTNLEPICKKLNVNLIPKLILNFCPSIALTDPNKEAMEHNFNSMLQVVYDFKNPEENLFLDPVTDFAPLPRAPDNQCLTYVVLHNWVLAHIIKKIHTSPDESSLQQSMDARTRCINNYMELERFNITKDLYGRNKYLASLHTTVDLDKLFVFMPELMEAGKILKCLNIIDSLTERQLKCSANLSNLRDLILFKLSTNPKVRNNWRYCQYLRCPELKVDLILNNLSSWPADGAIEVLEYLRFILSQESLEEGLYEKCSDWMVKIPLYGQIASIMGENHWYNVFEKSIENPENIIEILMDSQQFKLCLEWADVHDVSENMKNLIVMNLLRQLFEYTNQATPSLVKELLLRLPSTQASDLIHDEISKVRNVDILQVCVDFVSESSFDWKSFDNIKIGLQIMLEIDHNMRFMFWELIENPLLMIEQFLMNSKLDVLSNILNKVAPNLKKDSSGDKLYYNIKSIESLVISRNAVDALLRFYAEKALDMRNPGNVCPPPPKPSDDSLLQSIDSINIEAATRAFIMPDQIPTKDQWVEDYSVDRCMLCYTSIFSMIIRRHHCRRCGRLVCHACSRQRMQVPTYPSGVKFRVCDDCFTQTMSRKSKSYQDNMIVSSTSDSANSVITCLDWCLSTSASKNDAVRVEFSFEFTPNVTLCLSIMKMHSINLDYPRFLLDRSDEVARELSKGGDARLLVRARRSLLLAAAELYARTHHESTEWSARVGAGVSAGVGVAETGAAHAARCLAHADAMATLVKHQVQHLVPHQGAHPSKYVAETGAAHAARCLAHADAMATLVKHQVQHLVPHQGAHPSKYVAETGAAHAARCLAHADAMATLVKHQVQHLVPHQGAHPSKYVAETGAAHAARCLAHADAMATLVKHQVQHLVPHQGAHPSKYVAETGAAHAARCLAHADAMATLVKHQVQHLVPHQGAHPSKYVAETGAAHAARCLAHADAMATLVKHQVQHLVPHQGAHPSKYVAETGAAHAARCLAHADAMATLVKHQVQHLVPHQGAHPSKYVAETGAAHAARCLAHADAMATLVKHQVQHLVPHQGAHPSKYVAETGAAHAARCLAHADAMATLVKHQVQHLVPHQGAHPSKYVAETGAAHAARCLAHADAMATLVKHQVQHLVPHQGAHPSKYVAETGAAHAARCLAHADAMATLVKHQVQHLVPHQGAHPSKYVAETGAAHAARCLAHADAMATLVKHQVQHLVPHQGAHPSKYVAETGAAHAARCLAHADAMATLVKHQVQHLVPHQGAHPSKYVAETGAAHAARCLAHADAMATLVKHQVQHLVPHQGAHPSKYVAETGAAHAARCLAHADAMATLVKHQVQHLVPHQGAHPSQIVRSLLEAEKWELALEIATKSGLPRNSVLAAWGKACLKAGCFRQAREKFAHCFKSAVNVCAEVTEDCDLKETENPFVHRRVRSIRHSERTSSISSVQSDGRPRSNPPLLNEIISMLEDMNYPVNHVLLHKAESIMSTNEKLTTMNSNKKKIQLTEPALNIMHTLASVKKIKQGDYSDFQTATVQPKKSLAQGLLRRNNNHPEPKIDLNKKLDPFFYQECVYYLSNYGSHTANIAFNMKHSNMVEVLKYCYDNLVEKETFTESVYMECLKKDKVGDLFNSMNDMDSTLDMWADYIMHICRTLEMSKRLDALYGVQCASGQHARAAATCALLYSRPLKAPHFAAILHARQHHLAAATQHLYRCVPVAANNKTTDTKSFQFHLDKVTIDNLMTTITRQIEVAKYLATCEANGRLSEKVLDEVIPIQRRDESADIRPLTLFGSNTDKIRLVAIILASGPKIEEGFDLAIRVITEHKLDSMNIYTHVARYLVNIDRFMEVKTLAKCIRVSKETAASLMSDQVLEAGVGAVVARCEARGQMYDEQAELLIADVHSVTVKISCYLVCRNVSSAYILAARNERTNDLRRILQAAERIGNDQVRNACIKRLTSKNVL